MDLVRQCFYGREDGSNERSVHLHARLSDDERYVFLFSLLTGYFTGNLSGCSTNLSTSLL